MGCDFNIYGYQADSKARARCLDFVREWMGLVWKDLPDEEDWSIGAQYPVDTGVPVVRRKAGTFRRSKLRLADEALDDDRAEAWDQGMVEGLVIPWRPDPFLFDTGSNYRLCHLDVEKPNDEGTWRSVREFWTVALDKFDRDCRLVLKDGFYTRIPAGTAHSYVFAEVLRRHFISDYDARADYDMPLYGDIFSRIGTNRRLGAVGKTSLAERAVECATDAQGIYDEIAEESARRREERRKAAEAKFIKHLGSWEREVYFATKYTWQFMKDLPLLGLQDLAMNPILFNSLKGDLENWDIGSEEIRQVGISERVVEALESIDVAKVRDMLMLTEMDILQLEGFDEGDVRELREIALVCLGKDSAREKGATVKFNLGDDV